MPNCLVRREWCATPKMMWKEIRDTLEKRSRMILVDLPKNTPPKAGILLKILPVPTVSEKACSKASMKNMHVLHGGLACSRIQTKPRPAEAPARGPRTFSIQLRHSIQFVWDDVIPPSSPTFFIQLRHPVHFVRIMSPVHLLLDYVILYILYWITSSRTSGMGGCQ